MHRVLVVFASVALASGVAEAQPSPAPLGHHAMHLVKLPNGDYTVPMSELESSGTSGKVTLHPIGMKTLVTVNVYGRITSTRSTFTRARIAACTALRIRSRSLRRSPGSLRKRS